MRQVTNNTGGFARGLIARFLMSWVAVLMLPAIIAQAASINQDQARQVVQQWLAIQPRPLETPLGSTVLEVRVEADDTGAALYYVVTLSPQGFVVIAADDELEPIIAFSAGTYGTQADQPLRDVLRCDMQKRFARLHSGRWSQRQRDPARGKWRRLQRPATERTDSGRIGASSDAILTQDDQMTTMGMSGITDLRVPPLVQSQWGQGTEWGQACYNYYTPNQYPVGCTGTALAQLMRFYQHPATGIGVHGFTIYVDDVAQTAYTRGGNGGGGPYLWSQMPLDPPGSITTTEREAIGALCYDASVTIGTGFTPSGSGASLQAAKTALIDVFDYDQAVIGFSNDGNIGSGLNGMINPNLDAGGPLLLGVAGPIGSHAVIADGYGYDTGTLYHHINLGWNGGSDAWYALPNIDLDGGGFTTVGTCIYNISTSGSGEIISGRVTDAAGNPLPDVQVACKIGSTVVAQSTTNSRGIYALRNLAGQQTYTVTATKTPYGFLDQQATTGLSQDYSLFSGNVWGVDFTSVTAGPPTAYDMTVSAQAGTAQEIVLLAADDHLPNPPGQLQYRILTLPKSGTLSDPAGGVITAVPYTLSAYGTTVAYTGCPYFSGEDTFSFQANDGGTAPQGGYSAPASVTVNVDNHIYTTYERQTNLVDGNPFHTSSHEARLQSIYHADELGGPQTMTALAIHVYQLPGQPLNRWTIRLQHTDWTDYNVSGDFLAGGWTTVYQSNEPVGNLGWRTFTFQTPFVYNGVQNLLIDFSFDNASATTDGFCFFSGTDGDWRSLMNYADGDAGDPLNWTWAAWLGGSVPNLMLTSLVTAEPLPGDINCNCHVDLPDLGIMAAAWLSAAGQPSYQISCDISPTQDGVINLLDLSVLAENWLTSY